MRKWIIFSLVIVGIIGAGIWINQAINRYMYGDSEKKEQMLKDVEEHLFKEKKYKPSEISKIDVWHNFKSQNYDADVLFKDEPDIYYSYIYFEGKIMQAGPVSLHKDGSQEYKHKDDEEFHLKMRERQEKEDKMIREYKKREQEKEARN